MCFQGFAHFPQSFPQGFPAKRRKSYAIMFDIRRRSAGKIHFRRTEKSRVRACSPMRTRDLILWLDAVYNEAYRSAGRTSAWARMSAAQKRSHSSRVV